MKVKNKNDSLICQRVWKNTKCQGKIREKSGNFEVDDKWQPCKLFQIKEGNGSERIVMDFVFDMLCLR